MHSSESFAAYLLRCRTARSTTEHLQNMVDHLERLTAQGAPPFEGRDALHQDLLAAKAHLAMKTLARAARACE